MSVHLQKNKEVQKENGKSVINFLKLNDSVFPFVLLHFFFCAGTKIFYSARVGS